MLDEGVGGADLHALAAARAAVGERDERGLAAQQPAAGAGRSARSGQVARHAPQPLQASVATKMLTSATPPGRKWRAPSGAWRTSRAAPPPALSSAAASATLGVPTCAATTAEGVGTATCAQRRRRVGDERPAVMARGRDHAGLVRPAVDGGQRAHGVRLRAGLVEDARR